MAEAIAFGVVSDLVTDLTSSIRKEIGLMCGVNDEVKRLKDTVSAIDACLSDAEEKMAKNPLVQDWVRKLNDVLYEADNVLDAFAYKAEHAQFLTLKEKVSEFFSTSNPLTFRLSIAHKINNIRKKLDDIASDMSKLNFIQRVGGTLGESSVSRQTHSFELESNIIGRDEDREKIVNLLLHSDNSIIPIVGMGGLGKTTLCQFVYNDERVQTHFKLKMWVCVSEPFDVKLIVENIIKSANHSVEVGQPLDQLQKKLREILGGGRYLLVLDDVWNEDPIEWSRFAIFLEGDSHGSKILVTTRSTRVASVITTNPPYDLGTLTDKQSWDLFEKLAFREGSESVLPVLKEMGEEIVKRCKGVPLAVKTLGSMLQSKTSESQWRSVKESAIWQLSQNENHILPVLKLSYVHLPTVLKQCFLYCSIFPKDYTIQKDKLIRLWMAHGYLSSSSSGNQSLEDIGDRFVEELLFRSFFQEAVKDEYGDIKSFKMHDLIHDLAQSVAGPTFASNLGGDAAVPQRALHVSIHKDSDKVPIQLHGIKNLRSLFLLRWGSLSRESATNYFCFESLRVLDLRCSGIEIIPRSIGKLKHLRYLDLSQNDMKRLPRSICNLHNLQTLNLAYCSDLEELPKDIERMRNLRCLLTNGCHKLTHMPAGVGKLSLLCRLPVFVLGFGHHKGAKLSEMKDLDNLEGELKIVGLENSSIGEAKQANMKGKQRLRSLELHWNDGITSGEDDDETTMEELQPHSNIKMLEIYEYRGLKFPAGMFPANLVRIKIFGCGRLQSLPVLGGLPFLKVLEIGCLNEVEYVEDSGIDSTTSTFFQSLEKLMIRYLPKLKGWWREQVDEKLVPSFPCLSNIVISFCPNLNSWIPWYPRVKQLNLDRVPEKLLQQLSTTKFPPLSELRSLCVKGMGDRVNLEKGLLQNITYLEDLTIRSWPELVSVEEEAFMGLTCLKTLSIQNCKSLRSVLGALGHLTALETLSFYDFEEVGFLEEDGGMAFQSLSRLEIKKIKKMVSLPKGIQQATALQILQITHCPDLKDLPEWMCNFSELQNLMLWDCPKLASLPNGISSITSLKLLHIYKCPLLEERCKPETGEDWPKIAHIPQVTFSRPRYS